MNYSNEIFLEEIKHKFSLFSFEYREVKLKGEIPVFFVKVPTEKLLKDQWESVSHFIAGNFQSGLSNEYSVWNIYVFFITDDAINDELKYVIENDTFSSRKIVIAPQLEIDEIIKEHITNSDLEIVPAITEQEIAFEANPIIWEYLNQIPYKKKVTDEITASLNLIIKNLKPKGDEI